MLTLPWKFSLWWHLANLFGVDLPAGHTNSKLALEIFPPRSLTQQYDWLTKIWDIARAIPRVAEKTFEKVWGLLRVLLKNPHRLRAEKCLPLLFTSKLEQGPFCGKSCVVEVVVNCAPAVRVWNRGCYWLCKEFHKDFFKLASMELCSYTLNNFNRLQNLNFRR